MKASVTEFPKINEWKMFDCLILIASFFIHSMTFIIVGDAVCITGDDVAVPDRP
jgi:hypothetical protein